MSAIIVFGAGGRAGRAVLTEARDRGHRVTAVVRDPAKHGGLVADAVARGDATDADAVASLSRGHDAAVSAVTPVSGPEELAARGFDDRFFVRAAEALLRGLASAGVPRLLTVGLFANLDDGHGRLLLDDPSILPARLRPFALAHTAGLDALRATQSAVDWVMFTPPALLDPTGPRTGRYRVGGDIPPAPGSAHLSYADLAVAMLDEIETPRHHRARVSVSD